MHNTKFTIELNANAMKLIYGVLCFYFIKSAFAGGRILNGYPIEIEQAPYIVHMRFQKDRPHHYGFCGGSIINSRYILTAGHCKISYEFFLNKSIPQSFHYIKA